MATLDVFNSDPFSVVSLTDNINKLNFVPGRIGQLGIFKETGVNTTSVAIEQKNGVLKLIEPTQRGAPGTTLTKNKRSLRNLTVPHFEVEDAVYAEEIQNVRAWGSESELETVQGKITERQGEHSQSFEATHEYSRVGAVKGIVTYADGSALNLFNEFGVSQLTEVDFDLDAASPASGVLRKACAGVVRNISDELGGTPATGIHAFCSNEFFDALIAHSEVVESYRGTSMATILRDGYVLPTGQKIYGVFEFGGIVWENYRGSVGGQAYIDANKCHIFPVGVPGLFRTYYSPADWMETVNTIGQRLYSKQYAMLNGKGVHLDTQMNVLDICTRPRVLVKGKTT